jgi:Flp pilus assembly protein TadG
MLFRHPSSRADYQGRTRRGAAAVELALVVPFLAILFLGMTEMSRMLIVKVALNNAARKGCQTGILVGKTNQDITADTIDVMRTRGFSSTQFNPPSVGSVTITVTDPAGTSVSDALSATAGSKVTVQVAVPVSSTAWITSYFLSSTTSQSETVVMKKQ